MQLTDSEQRKLLEDISTITRQKIRAMGKRIDELIEISKKDLEEIQQLRNENRKSASIRTSAINAIKQFVKDLRE